MRLRRALRVAVTAAAVATAGYAAAASLGSLGSSTLGAGDAPVAACQSGPLTTSYIVAGAKITDITISGITDPDCEGAQLSFTLTDSSDVSVGAASQTVPTDGDTTANSMTVPVTAQPDAALVTDIHIAIVGP